MSEDRFGDLGEDRRSAAERFADLDITDPEPDERPRPQRPRSPYSWVVGIVFLIAIAAAGLNAIGTQGPGSLGPEEGEDLPEFVAPLATTGPDRDANLDQPCSVQVPDAVNVCDLKDRPVVITFMFTRFADCEPQLDRVERVRERVPGVEFVGVIVREPKDKAARIVRKRGWGFPVALDRDGLVSNVYGISGCPTTVFARRGGKVAKTRVGDLSEAELIAEARRLLAPPARAGGAL